MTLPTQTYGEPLLEFVLPVHNEAESIAATLVELHDVLTTQFKIPTRFVISEDGSKDRTVEVLIELSNRLPIILLSEPGRRGYSKAVVDGAMATTSQYIAFVDSDGQFDPRDFGSLWKLREQYDLVAGYRNPRRDHWIRALMSRAFGIVYSLFFKVPFRDPSCPYLLVRREALQRIFRGTPGILEQGFWWEFVARATAANLKMTEVPVSHRARAAGITQVYRPTKLPRIVYRHFKGLIQLRRQLESLRNTP